MIDLNDKIYKYKNIPYYRCSCKRCGKDRGYQRKHQANKLCRSCTNRYLKTGKPSPKKGIKTNKPAHNRGKYFLNIEKKMLRDRMSRRLRHALSKRSLSKKWLHIFNILGYSVEMLQHHLESKFTEGMTWNNIGQWEIDHIKPESLFNYSSIDDNEFKKCWSLENLQPLWKHDNRSKNDKYQGVSNAQKCK